MHAPKPNSEDIPLDAENLIRFATILSVDLQAGRCIALIGDDGEGAIETPPIRWIAPRAGATWVWSPPSEGEQVIILSPSGEIEGAVAIMGIASDIFPPASASQADQITFADGTKIIYDAQAQLMTIDIAAGGSAIIKAPAGLTIEGDVAITGDVAIDGQLTTTGDQIADGISAIDHKHGGVQSGSSLTGAAQ